MSFIVKRPLFECFPVCGGCVWSREVIGIDSWSDDFYLTVGCHKSRVRKDGSACPMCDETRPKNMKGISQQICAAVDEKLDKWSV